MAWDSTKQTYCCDRCGKRLGYSWGHDKVQLCENCDKILEKQTKEGTGHADKDN